MRMRGLLNLLFMFGPMIYRQFQKHQRNKQRTQHQHPQRREHLPREKTGEYIKHEEVKEKYLEPDDPNEVLTEKDIMLDKSDLRHFDRKSKEKQVIDPQEEKLELDDPRLKKEKLEESDLDLKDFFLD